MNDDLKNLIITHSGELITFVATSLIALIKRKVDLMRMRKKGKLID